MLRPIVVVTKSLIPKVSFRRCLDPGRKEETVIAIAPKARHLRRTTDIDIAQD